MKQTSWLGVIVIDPRKGEHGLVREVTARLHKGMRRRVMVQVELQGALKADGHVTRWYRARNLVRVGPYAVVQPRARKPLGQVMAAKFPDIFTHLRAEDAIARGERHVEYDYPADAICGRCADKYEEHSSVTHVCPVGGGIFFPRAVQA